MDDHLLEDLIFLNYNFSTKQESLDFLVRNLKNKGYLLDDKKFLREISFRERESSTAMGNGIAIPHAQSKEVTRSNVSILKLKNNIDWGESKVNLIFLISIKKDELSPEKHMRVLSKIAQVLLDEKKREMLRDCNNPKLFADMFKV